MRKKCVAMFFGLSALSFATTAQPPEATFTNSKAMEDAWSGRLAIPPAFLSQAANSFEILGLSAIKLTKTAAPFLAFSRLELQLSRVDDTATLWFNGRQIQQSAIGTQVPFQDVTPYLQYGTNTVRVSVGNGGGGACGVVLTARFNQNNALARSWEWRKSWSPSEITCVDESFTIWRFPPASPGPPPTGGPPAGFHAIELKMDEIDDVMNVWVENPAHQGQLLDATYMQYAKPWHDVSQFFIQGDNWIHIRIDNPGGGPCGGRISLLVDGAFYGPPNWKWHKDWFPSDKGPCFDEKVLVSIP